MMSIVDTGKLLILLAFWALVSLADNLPWSARVIEQGRLLTLLARRALVSLADYLPLSARVHKKSMTPQPCPRLTFLYNRISLNSHFMLNIYMEETSTAPVC